MPSLSEILGESADAFSPKVIVKDMKTGVKESIANTKTDVVNTIKNEIDRTVSNAKNDTRNAVRGTIMGVAAAGVNGVLGAATSILKGDGLGAIESIAGIGTNAYEAATRGIGALGSVFGIKSGTQLSGPGMGGTVASTNGGVDPRDTINGMMARPDPAMSYCWYAEMPVISAGSTAMLPWYYVEESTMPFRDFQVRSIFRNGANRHYPTTYSVSALRMGIYMDVGGKSLAYLQAWEAAMLRKTTRANIDSTGGGWRAPALFKKDITIYLLSVTKDTIAKVTYVGCWPTNLSDFNLNSAPADRIVNQINFSVDDVVIELLGESATAVAQTIGMNPPQSDADSSRIVSTALGTVARSSTNAITSGAAKAVSSVSTRISSFF